MRDRWFERLHPPEQHVICMPSGPRSPPEPAALRQASVARMNPARALDERRKIHPLRIQKPRNREIERRIGQAIDRAAPYPQWMLDTRDMLEASSRTAAKGSTTTATRSSVKDAWWPSLGSTWKDSQRHLCLAGHLRDRPGHRCRGRAPPSGGQGLPGIVPKAGGPHYPGALRQQEDSDD